MIEGKDTDNQTWKETALDLTRSTASNLSKSVLFLPRFVFSNTYGMMKYTTHIFRVEDTSFDTRARLPRFISYNKELEEYSSKKAYGQMTLNKINLHVTSNENIKKLFSLQDFLIILTERRIICVKENSSQ